MSWFMFLSLISNASAHMIPFALWAQLPQPSKTEFHAGWGPQTCVIARDGRIKCWGYNNSGQLGLGDTTSRGTSAAQMGDSLPFISWY